MGGVGVVRLEAGANHSSEKARMREESEEEMRSIAVRHKFGGEWMANSYRCRWG